MSRAEWDVVKAILFIVFIVMALGFAGYQDRIDAERGIAPPARPAQR